MGLQREQLDVLTEDVGGAFGLKTSVYPEYPALLVAAAHHRPHRTLDVDALGSTGE